MKFWDKQIAILFFALQSLQMIAHDDGIDDCPSYANKNIFSQRNSLWSKYVVEKPRLPSSEELNGSALRWVDDPINRPSTFSLYVGVHNLDLNRSLRKIIDDFSDSRILPNIVLLHGAKGNSFVGISFDAPAIGPVYVFFCCKCS